MALLPMYPGKVNSPQTELASAIDDEQTTIPLLDASVLPDPPNIATIGTGEDAETILYTGVSGNDLTGVTRGFQGAAKAWSAGQKVARNFTAYDYDALRQNLNSHGSEHNHDGSDPIPALDQLRDDYNFHLTDIAAHDITRSATIVIASSTSRNKDQADFVCDGVSDHVQLQQALDSLSTSGGRVILLEGIYNFSSFVLFPSNIFVEGQGSSTQIIYPASSGTSDAVWRIAGQNNCTIKNLVLDGGGEREHSGIRVINSTNVRLEGVTVRNFAGQFAIRLGGAYNIAFRCLTENNTGGGLELNGDYNLAVGCISRNNGMHGIRAVEVYKNRRLVACISIDNGSHGIDLNPATAVPSDTQTSVIGCLASGNQGYGIYIPSTGMENVIIDGCHLSGNVQGNLLDNGTNTIIGDNYIEEA